MSAIWWIRRDLRLTDNPALHASLELDPIFPVFILDPAFDSASPRRKDFLYAGLHALGKDLRERNSYLVIRTGRPVDVLRELVRETGAAQIFTEEDFTPYARKRDAEVEHHLPLNLVNGQTVHHPASVLKSDGKPYTIYTPYSRAWKAKLPSTLELYPASENINTPPRASKATLCPRIKSTRTFRPVKKKRSFDLKSFSTIASTRTTTIATAWILTAHRHCRPICGLECSA